MEVAEKMTGENRSRLAGNAISLTIAGAAGMLFTLMQLSILSRYLDSESFGLFVALRGFSLLFSTLILAGLPQVIIRFIPSYQNRGETSRALILFGVSIIIILLLGTAVVLSRGSWKGLVPDAGSDPAIIGWLAAVSVAIALKLLLYSALNGQRVMHYQMILELLYLAVFTCVIFFMRYGLGLAMLFRLSCLLNAGVFLAGLPFVFLSMKNGRSSHRVPKGEKIITPSFMPYLGNSILLSLVALAFTDFDRFLMSSVLPLSSISLFHIASRINSLLKRFLGYPVIALQPEITRIYEEGRYEELKEKIVLFTKTTFISALFFVFVTAVAGRGAIRILSGEAFDPSYRILLVLLPCVPVAALIAPLLSTMKGLHFMRWAVLADFVWMGVYFGTFLVFVSAMGVTGMAVAQLCASLTQMVVVVAVSKKYGFYGGVGRGSGRALAAFTAFTVAGAFAVHIWGLPASVTIVVLSPFILKGVVSGLKLFDNNESEMLKNMIRVRLLQNGIAWITGN
ncbi:MAG: lipopolysaccharide biosynthesis protein [Candidatus Krumholzibacteria bacterium]|nr:lipopolysaccharide biosynthesis protein [Candidatus Krumholzibacteria bacterium]